MTVYSVDPRNSTIGFKVKHLMITTVSGHFAEYSASIETVEDNEDFSNAVIQFSANVDSLSTGVIDRDTHLKSAEIFDVVKWPKIYYRSTAVTKNENGDYSIAGAMTLKTVTRDLELTGVYKGSCIDLQGVKKYRFEVYGSLSRKDFNLHIHGLNGAGNVLVDDKVNLFIDAQMIKI